MITEKDKIRLVLTNKCNMNCEFCVDANIRNESTNSNVEFISLENIDKAITFAKERGINEFTLTGGEPTLHPQFEEIAKRIKANGFKVKVITNYLLPDVLKKVDGILDDITISYYQQKLPNPGDFKSTKLKLSIILDKKNFSKFEDLDYYIDKYSDQFRVTFRTMWRLNDYCEHQQVSFLNELDKLEFSIHDRGRVTNIYRNHRIYRIDLPKEGPDADNPHYKMHVDGTIANDFADVYQDIKMFGNDTHCLKRIIRDTKDPSKRKAIAQNPIFNLSKSQIEWVLENETLRDLATNFRFFGTQQDSKVDEFMPGTDEPDGEYIKKHLLIFCGSNASGKTTINKIFRHAYKNYHYFACKKYMDLSFKEAKWFCLKKRYEVLDRGDALIIHIHHGKESIYDLIKYAKDRNYTIDLVFATKLGPEYNMKMEMIRREYCTHLPVPSENVHYRYNKALETFPILFDMVDNARFFDTTDLRPILHIDKQGEEINIYPEKPWIVEDMIRNVPEMRPWNTETFMALIKKP